MNKALERADIFSDSPRTIESQIAYKVVLKHESALNRYLGIGTKSQFAFTEEARQAQKNLHSYAREITHPRRRAIRDIGMLVIGTVAQVEDECRHAKVLDIGCGEGGYGEALARNAKAQMTFVDIDPKALSNISKKAGKKVVADGRDLPFDNESFEKTFSVFSNIAWSESPEDTIISLNEALRVTEVGGTAFIIPAFANMTERDEIIRRFESGSKGYSNRYVDDETILGLKVWALRDHVLLNALESLEEDGFCAITWGGIVGDGTTTGHRMEQVSAIIDIEETIPTEVLVSFLTYARKFSE